MSPSQKLEKIARSRQAGTSFVASDSSDALLSSSEEEDEEEDGDALKQAVLRLPPRRSEFALPEPPPHVELSPHAPRAAPTGLVRALDLLNAIRRP